MKSVVYSLLWLMATAATGGQPVTNSNAVRTVMVAMRDGVKLATDVYLPAGNALFPVVLMRTPYNKSGVASAAPAGTKLGYAVVVQDTRGRFASEGENLPFNVDDHDGYDTIKWITAQGWCNGKIGTYGGSALGITQLQLVGTASDGLACQHITVGAPNIWEVVYTGGVFRKSLVEDWLRTSNFSPRALELWVGHDAYDNYWQQRDASQRYGKMNVPAVHIGGYYDIFGQATIDAFLGLQTHGGPGARGRQKLLMGPWTHSVLMEKSGELVFPKAQRPPNNVQDQVRWWECYLKGVNNGVASLPAVTYYVMGDTSDPNAPGNVWRTADQWPPVPTQTTRWYLGANQTLTQTRAATEASSSYIYDPTNPVPTVGGYQLTLPAGPRDQRSIESRDDVLVFTSAPLAQPLEVTGQVRVKLYVSTDVPDTDFIARLCDVYPDGRSFNVCEGALRARYRNSFERAEFLKPGRIYQINVDLASTSIIFNKEHRLRVHVTSSSAPGYDPNSNTDEPLRWSDRKQVAHTTIHITDFYASRLELPVAAGAGK
jgi:predicted acyl esterase